MFAGRVKCQVLETRWATPTVFLLRFKPSRRFHFLPGQFLSVVIPTNGAPLKRCYSLATSPEESARTGHYELCVKLVAGGAGSTYLSQLRPGDRFVGFAPYGGFTYRPSGPERNVLFIGTSTGIAPLRSMVASEGFQQHRPRRALVLYGAREEREILYERDFRTLGVELVVALSRPESKGLFKGRVTDYLRGLSADFPWHSTDYYLCGNGEMIREVNEILRGVRGVSPRSIYQENFSPPKVVPQPGIFVVEPEDEPLVPSVAAAGTGR